MKLYILTEEQLRILLWKYSNKNEMDIKNIINSMPPIELPSDEDIDKKAFQVPYDGTDIFYDKSFIKGAKSVIEQILNQNK